MGSVAEPEPHHFNEAKDLMRCCSVPNVQHGKIFKKLNSSFLFQVTFLGNYYLIHTVQN
jgi:hypothetical protein